MTLAAPLPGPDATVTAILGPTNTGKTHYAIERMLARADGVIGLPLRLLAREVYDKIVELRGPGAVALITGEEKIQPAKARYFVCTVEAMPVGRGHDFVAIDEVQMCADPERGHVFTDRLLRARGRYETLFLGSDAARPRIAALVPGVRFAERVRYSTLSYAGSKKLSRLKPRSAVVAFSMDQVYAIAELIRRQRGGAAVVMGALSPRTRNAQVALYQQGDVDYLVATDAIGMGLNLDVDHIAFAGHAKFDGRRHRRLERNELAQIAGRAGRYTRDGTFGVTGEAPPLEDEVVEAIEGHRFKPIKKLMWRNHELDHGTLERLIASLETLPESPDLARAREADDQITLRALAHDPEIRALADRPARVRLLWEVCQVPDFRKVTEHEHAHLISRIYRFLLGPSGAIPSDWIAGQVTRIDRADGDIDTLAKRLAFIRTWTYVAQRSGWVEDAAHWQAMTRGVEDRLSDALHERLTQRFVDRRTSVLLRRLKQKERLVAEVNESGEVTVEGEFLGRLDGFRFTIDETATPDEVKTLRSASMGALQAELTRRADRLYLATDQAFDVTEQGGLLWDNAAVGQLVKGEDRLTPKVRAFVDEHADPTVAEKIERRLGHWLQRRVAALFEPLIKMRDDETVTGLARGVAFQLVEAMGVIPRRQIADDIKALGQDERAMLRRHGVRFGQHTIFMPLLLKPAPTRLRLLFWALWEGLEEVPTPPPPGQVTLARIEGMPHGYWDKAGYKLCGVRAVRIDMLERLADILRPLDARAGFEATPEMLSITGCTLDQLAEILDGLGFQGERGERPKQPRPNPVKSKPAKGSAQPDETVSPAPAEGAAAPAEGAAGPAETEAASETAASDTAPASDNATEATAEAPSDEATPSEAPSSEAPSSEAPSSEAPVDTAPVAEAPAGTEVTTEADTPVEASPAPVAEETAPADQPPATEPETPAAPLETLGNPDEAKTARTAVDDTAAAPAVADAEADGSGEARQAPETEVFYVFTLKPRRPAGGPRRGRGGPPGDRAAGSPGERGGERGGEREARGDRRGEGEGRGPRRRGPRQDAPGGDGHEQRGGAPRGDGQRHDRNERGGRPQGQRHGAGETAPQVGTAAEGSATPVPAEGARPQANPRQGAEARQGGSETGRRNAGGGGGPDGLRGKGKGKGKGKRREDDRNFEPRDRDRDRGRPKEDKPIDPDSPFAILQQLKNR